MEEEQKGKVAGPEYKAMLKDGSAVRIYKDKFHYRAFDANRKQVGEPFVHIDSLLRALGAELAGAQNPGGADLNPDGRGGAVAGGAEINPDAHGVRPGQTPVEMPMPGSAPIGRPVPETEPAGEPVDAPAVEKEPAGKPKKDKWWKPGKGDKKA